MLYPIGISKVAASNLPRPVSEGGDGVGRLESPMLTSTAQAISTVGIWLAVAVTLAFGVFHSNWSGIGIVALLVIVPVICGAAAWATGAVWGKVGPAATPPRPSDQPPPLR